MNEGNRQLVGLMEHVWQSISELCDGFGEAEWNTPTDCPGWSVQDQVSHLAGSETGILGDPDPDHTPGEAALAHTRSEQGRRNEVVVDWRRSWAGAQVLSDFRAKTAPAGGNPAGDVGCRLRGGDANPGGAGAGVGVYQHSDYGRLGA